MSLTASQIKNYENNGYISPIDVLSKKEAHEIREEIELIEKKWPNELEGLGRNYVHLISPILILLCTSLPQISQPGVTCLENNSTLFCDGNISSIRFLTSAGFVECVPRSSLTSCLMFLAPRGLGILPFFPMRHNSH